MVPGESIELQDQLQKVVSHDLKAMWFQAEAAQKYSHLMKCKHISCIIMCHTNKIQIITQFAAIQCQPRIDIHFGGSLSRRDLAQILVYIAMSLSFCLKASSSSELAVLIVC